MQLKILLLLILYSFSGYSAEVLKSLNQFQKKILPEQKVTLSLYNNKNYLGEFNAFVTSSGEIKTIEKKSYQVILELYLLSFKFTEFQNTFKESEFLTPHQLDIFGLNQTYDINNFKVDLKVPESFLNPSHISISQQTIDQSDVNIYPSHFSSYMNYSFNEQLTQDDLHATIRQSRLTGSLDPVVSFAGNVFESHHLLDASGDWMRSGSTVSRDLVNQKMRVSVGDLNYLPRYFQSNYHYAGLKVSTAFDISPYTITTSTGEKEIFLDSPSIVEVFINGFLLQSLTLEAGKHILEDIPLSQGINVITVKITDSSGKIRFLYFEHTGSEAMLKKGIHDFSYDFGTLSDFNKKNIHYNSNPIISFYHRYGMNNFWTTGINSQLMRNHFILGAENQIGAPIGLLVNDLSFSQSSHHDLGAAMKFSYVWTHPTGTNEQLSRLAISQEYQSPHYLANITSSLFSLNNTRHSTQISFSRKINDQISGIFQSTLGALIFSKFDLFQYNLGFNYRLNTNLSTNFYWTKTINEKIVPHETSDSILFQLSYNFSDGKKNLIGSVNKSNNSNNGQVEYSYNSNKAVYNSIYRARVASSEADKSAYISNYFNTQYNELTSSFEYLNQSKRKEVNINPTGALTFVNGKFALGQRVNQSFIVVENDYTDAVLINGDQDNYEALIQPNHRSVLTGVQPYVAKKIATITDDNSMYGFSNNDFRVMSYYKSGSYLKLSKPHNYSVEGTLLNENGSPLALVGAKLVLVSSGEEIPFFTGREGNFIIDNVLADSYQIFIFDKQKVRSVNIDLSKMLKNERNFIGKIIVK